MISEQEAECNRREVSHQGERSRVGESFREKALSKWVGFLFDKGNEKGLVPKQKGPGLGGRKTVYNNIFGLRRHNGKKLLKTQLFQEEEGCGKKKFNSVTVKDERLTSIKRPRKPNI